MRGPIRCKVGPFGPTLALLVASGSAQAQWDPTVPPAPVQGEDVEEDEDEFLFRPFIGLSSLSLALESGQGEQDPVTLEYQPNSALSVGVRGGYGPYMASGSIATVPSEETEVYGRSRSVDLQLATALRADEHEVVAGVFFQQYRGFYLEGARRFDPAEMEVVTFPRMKARAVGVSMTFFLDPAFSYEDAFMEYRPRRQSEGSWVLRLSMGHLSVDAGGAALVPETQRARFGLATGLQSVSAAFASASVGYSYDWMIGHGWFLGSQFLLGLNTATVSMTMGPDHRRRPSFDYSGTLHLALGYTGERFHGGAYVGSELERMRLADSTLQMMRNFLVLFAGIRF